ncbi:MAG: hypothetical protein AMXMBFR56_76900 [Polyangiaceae bacterium]
MPAIPHWAEGEETGGWDTLILADQFMAGVAAVTVKRPVTKLDKQKTKDTKGQKKKNTGPDSADVDIELTVVNRDDLAVLEQTIALIYPPNPSGEVRPLTIQHPNTDAWGVHRIVVEDVSSAMPRAKGGWVIKIKASEYVEEPKPSKGLGGAAGLGAESCAALTAKAAAATSKRESLQAANAEAIATLGKVLSNQQLVSTSQIATAKAHVKETATALELAKAEEGALYAAIASKCKKTAAPPSKTADQNVMKS